MKKKFNHPELEEMKLSEDIICYNSIHDDSDEDDLFGDDTIVSTL